MHCLGNSEYLPLLILALACMGSAVNYEEPSEVLELVGKAIVTASSCGNSESCSDVKYCASGRVSTPNATLILNSDKFPEVCRQDPDLTDLPAEVIPENGYINLTSSNKDNCTRIRIPVTQTGQGGYSFWVKRNPGAGCDLFATASTDVGINPSNFVGINGTFEVKTDAELKQGWNHIFIRPSTSSASTLFINGMGFLDTSSIPRTNDIQLLWKAGCDYEMADFRFYPDILTDREIRSIFENKTLDDDSIGFPDCRCPSDSPVLILNDQDPTGMFCTQMPSSTKTPRLKNSSPDFSRDKNDSTYWSTLSNSASIAFTFEQVYMIDRISVDFSGTQELEISLEVDAIKRNTKMIQPSSSTAMWLLRNNTFPQSESTRAQVETLTANKISITLSNRQGNNPFKMTKISISGRCYCNGNSQSCTSTGRTFNCTSCKENRMVTGSSCELCNPGIYRSQDQFDCSSTCNCDTIGTVPAQKDTCQTVGGQCKCKDHVTGRACDKCKPLYFNLTTDKDEGCQRCDCGAGTDTCDEQHGRCTCKPNVENLSGKCLTCMEKFFNVKREEGCVACNCNTKGTIARNWNCSDSTGQCSCKERVQGIKCDKCQDGFYNLNIDNSKGCTECDCNRIGSINISTCDKGQGQCRCRGSLTDNIHCNPSFLPDGISPVFGPVAGGTVVSINGRLFGNDTAVTHFRVGSGVYQSLEFLNDSYLTFVTPSYSKNEKVQITLQWEKVLNNNGDFTKTLQFEYRLDPIIQTTVEPLTAFKSGGCKITLTGSNLNSVSSPQLIIYNADGTQRGTVKCEGAATKLICDSPTGSKGQILRYGVELDGVAKYKNFNMFMGNNITIINDPAPVQETEMELDYKPVFKTELKIEGAGFDKGCSSDDFQVVLVGTENYTCIITSRSSGQIVCEPDVGFPGPHEKVEMKLIVGGKTYPIQTVQLWSFWRTPEFIGIAVGGSIFIVLIVVLICIICCCCRGRRVEKVKIKNDDQVNLTDINVNLPDSLGNGMQRKAKPNAYEGVQMEGENWKAFIHRTGESVRKLLEGSHVHFADIVPGKRCINKGKEIRVTDGSYASGTGKANAGKPCMMKCLVEDYNTFGSDILPDWVNNGFHECLRFQDVFDENFLQTQGVATDGDRFYVMYGAFQRNLKDHLNDTTVTDLKVGDLLNYCVQLMEGVQYLHNVGIIHKDIAARNCVMVDRERVQVTDGSFSWSLFPEEYLFDEQRGKYLPVRWMAPESLTAGFYDTASDVWSFGVLIWEIMSSSAVLPYPDVANNKNIREHIEKGFRLGKPDGTSESLYTGVMLESWNHHSDHRIKISEIGDKFELLLHPNSDISDPLYLNQEDTGDVYYNIVDGQHNPAFQQ